MKKNTMKLRSLQSIHDFCLAGDYLVIFECSMNLSYWNTLFGSHFFDSIIFNENLPKLVHIFRKEDLSHVRTIETPASYVFHFTNGFSVEKKVIVQYCNYQPQEAKHRFSFLEHVSNYAKGSER